MLDKIKSHPRYLENPAEHFDFGEEKWGVLFLNMGGPESADDVEEYLYNIFSDNQIISLPLSGILQKPLAKFISSRRAPRVKRRYQAIGGGSPLLKWSRLAASGVKRELSKEHPQVEVFVGMRYAEPYIDEELDAAVGEGCRHLVLFSMYPHYSSVTTGSALSAVLDWFDENEDTDMTFSLIDRWSDRSQYIALLRSRIDAALEKFEESEKPKIIFSAHAVPQKIVAKGDPYYAQVKRNVELAGEGHDYILSFQSRTGPVKWVEPDTIKTVQSLARQGRKELLVVPISFVSDHIETLYEIDIELFEIAKQAGITKFVRTESFNDDAAFTAFLTDLVEEKVQGSN